MQKHARKISQDPVQEKLRQNKANWNKEVSAFIDDLIHLKKLMNGWPNKFFMERSYIKDPVPADPTTILGALSGDFSELAQKGNALISQQIDYHKARRRKVTEKNPNQLSLPGISASYKYDLISHGSGAGSRFVSKLLSTELADGRKKIKSDFRKSALNIIPQIIKDINYFQYYIVKSSTESIHEASNRLNDLILKLSFLESNMNMYVQMMARLPSSKDGYQEADSDTDQDNQIVNENLQEADLVNDLQLKNNLDKAKNEYEQMRDNPQYSGLINYRLLSDIYSKYFMENNKERKDNYARQFISEWNKSKQEILFAGLNKQAQHLLGRMLGKTTHSLSLFDKSSSLRLNAYKVAEEMKPKLNQMMESLEKKVNIQKLKETFLDLKKDASLLTEATTALKAAHPRTLNKKK